MEKRIDKIKMKLQEEGEVFVADLSVLYNVTEETIRRDLEKLRKEGFVNRTFGGAVINLSLKNDRVHYFQRTSINQNKKKKIVSLLKNRIEGFSTVMLDNSTTVMEAVKLLKDNSNLTAISFSTQIFKELNGAKMTVVSTGGIYDENTLSFRGTLAKDNIHRYNVDMALISCKGLDIQNGITDTSEGEAVLKKAMISRASRVALLADSTKFNQTAFVNFIDWETVDYLITDEKPSEEWVKFCEQNNIQLVYE